MEPRSKPPDAASVMAAVAASGDRELQARVTAPNDFVLRDETPPDFARHALYRVLLTGGSHPMSFWLAAPRSGDAAFVVSRSARAVNRLWQDETALTGLEGEAAVARFFDLYRHQGVHAAIAWTAPWSADKSAAATILRFTVAERFVDETWSVTLPTEGEATVEVETRPAPPPGRTP